ncbi:hypothetical protein ACHHYP_13263 [Achlya hypogyna]|uniref:Chorein N-terminal domain-containing protein n=1 Tax=Achlya hypogyna TaxID=1202772 RepID=A0A1V9YFQ8_ACHHY|nr:hypothetical protein ACHHYP_13263 [Achlya hypogyna]
MLDILSSPLKGYIAQTLQFYLSKYLKDIHLEGFGFFGNDLVLNDLEVKRHVLQSALDLPPTFDFSRGFIRELRIHIPWTQILSQPIEIKLYTVELILTAKDDSAPVRPRRNSVASEGSCTTMTTQISKTTDATTSGDQPMEPPKSTWLQWTLSKILANISIQINNLVLKYEEDDIVLSLTLGLLDLYSVGDMATWVRGFAEPKGDSKAIAKCIDAKDVSVFLDRYTSDRVAFDIDSDLIHRQVIGYEVPVLRRTTISLRCLYSLEQAPYEPAVPRYSPHTHSSLFEGTALDGADLLVLDVYVGELGVSLSDRQVQMLIALAAPKAAPPSPRRLVRASSSPQMVSDASPNDAVPPVALVLPLPATAAPATSWTSWVYGAIVGADDAADELEKELLASLEHPPPAAPPSPLECSITIADEPPAPPVALVTVRVSVQRASLTLRCHPAATAPSPAKGPSADGGGVEYVPVANVGLVPVDLSQHTKTKVSKAATVIGVVEIAGGLVRFVTDTMSQDVIVEVQNVWWHQPTTLVSPTLLRAGATTTVDAVEHPNTAESFFSDALAAPGWNIFRATDAVPVATACVCADSTASITAIEAYWDRALIRLHDCVDSHGNAHVLRLVDTVVAMLQKELRVIVSAPRLRREVQAIAQAFVQLYALDLTVLDNLERYFLPPVRTWTAVALGHNCVARRPPSRSAVRLRYLATPEVVSTDVALGPVNVELSLEALATYVRFVDCLDMEPLLAQPPVAAPATPTAMTMLHAASVSVTCTFDDDHTLHATATDVAVSVVGDHETKCAVGGLSAQLDGDNVLIIDQLAIDWRAATTGIIHTAGEAFLDAATARLSVPHVELVLGRLLPPLCDLLHIDYTPPVVRNAVDCQDVFAVDVRGVVAQSSLVLSEDGATASVRGHLHVGASTALRGNSVCWSTVGAKPWLQLHVSTEASTSTLVEWLPEAAAMVGIPVAVATAAPVITAYVQLDVAPVEVYWRHALALCATEVAFAADTRPTKTAVGPPPTSTIPAWTLELRVGVASSTMHLSRHLMLSTPSVRIQTDVGAVNAAHQRRTASGRCRLTVEVSPWSVLSLETSLMACDAMSAVVALEAASSVALTPIIVVAVDATVLLRGITVTLSPLQVALLAAVPTLPPTPANAKPAPLPTSAGQPVTWSAKCGVQLAHATCVLDGTDVLTTGKLVELFLAVQIGTSSPVKNPSVPSPAAYLDAQLQLHDATCVQVQEEEVLPPSHSLGAFDKILAAATRDVVAGILLCLDEADIRAFATAVRHDLSPTADTTIALWTETMQLVKACCDLSMHRRRHCMKTPIVCTSVLLREMPVDEPWVTLFARNYNANTGELFPWALLGSIDAVDVIVTPPTLALVVRLAQGLGELFPSLPTHSGTSSPPPPLTPMALPLVSLRAGTVRVLVPVESAEHTARLIVFSSDASTIESTPHLDIVVDGLSHPPFRALGHRQRAPSSSLQVAPKSKTTLRSGALYIAFADYDTIGTSARSPYEAAATAIGSTPVALVKVEYIVPPWFVAVEIAETAAGVKADVHITKVTVQLDDDSVNVLVRQAATLGQTLPQSSTSVVDELVKEDGAAVVGVSCQLDGWDLRLQSQDDVVLVRVGPAMFRNGDDGHLSVKNVVVGLRAAGGNDEELVFGPLCDPYDWQLAAEKYSEKLLLATWGVRDRSLTGLVEVQGVQLHLSHRFVQALLRSSAAFEAFPTPVPTPPSSPWTATRAYSSTLKLPSIGAVDHISVKLLWAPSQFGAIAEGGRNSVVVRTGALFASLHSRVSSSDEVIVASWPESPLYEWLPLKLLDFVVTWQSLGVVVLGDTVPVTVPLSAHLGRATNWQRHLGRLADAPALVGDVDVRCTGDAKLILRAISGTLLETQVWPIEAHIEANAVHVSLSPATLVVLDKWSSSWATLSAQSEDSVATPCHPSPTADLENEISTSDFTELALRLEPKTLHPRAGELIRCDAVMTNIAFEGPVLPPTVIPMSSPRTDDRASIDEAAFALDDILDELQSPWAASSGECLCLRWRYPIPRQLRRIVATPLPAEQAPAKWPKIYDRLCDVQCEVRCYDAMTGAFVALGIVHVPWARPASLLPRADSAPSFASALAQWIVDVDDPFAPTLHASEAWQRSFDEREYALPPATPATQWELRWRLPVGDPAMAATFGVVSTLLCDALHVRSVAAIDVVPLVHVALTLPEAKVSWQEGTDVPHEMLHVAVADASVRLRRFVVVDKLSCVVAGAVRCDLHNLTTLASTSLLQPWPLRAVWESSPATLSVVAGPLQLQLTQYALVFLTDLSQRLLVPPPPTPELRHVRISVENLTDHVLLFRQVGTREVREVAGLATVAYSWHSFQAPLQLQWTRALAQGWSSGCPVGAPFGVWYQSFKAGAVWVDVALRGVQTIVSLRGDIVVYNHSEQRLQYRVNSEAPVTLGESPQSHFLDRQTLQLSLRCDAGHPWSLSQPVASAAVPFAPVAATSAVEPPATLMALQQLGDMPPVLVWLSIKRAEAIVMKEASVHRVRRWSWLEVHLWPTMRLENRLSTPVVLRLRNQATGVTRNEDVAPGDERELLHYNPQQAHTMEWAPDAALALPAFATPDGDELAAFPSATGLRLDARLRGTMRLTRTAASPVRRVTFTPTLLVKNELPYAVIVSGTDFRAIVAPESEVHVALDVFTLGLEYPPGTTLWTGQACQWQPSLEAASVVWALPAASGVCFHAIAHHAFAADDQRRITLRCRYRVDNRSRFALQVLPTSLLSAKTSAVEPLVVAPADRAWPLATVQGRASTLHSGLKWIRTRLSRGNSIADDGPDKLLQPSADAPTTTCTLSVAIAASGYAWSQRPVELRPCVGQRLALLHSDATQSDLMLTYAVVAIDDAVVITIYEDEYPPVTLQNHLSRSIVVALTHSSSGVTVGAQDTVGYDWQLQDPAFRAVPPASVFDAPPSPTVAPHARFRVRVAADDWSNPIWLVEGIQFAKTPSLVLLVTMYQRCNVWMVHVECLDGGGVIKSTTRKIRRAPLLPMRLRVSVEQVVVRCYDDRLLTDGGYHEVARIDARGLRLAMLQSPNVSAALVPEVHRHRAALGYLEHVRSFATTLVSVDSLEAVHFFPDIALPRVLSCGQGTAPSVVSESELLTASIDQLVRGQALTLRVVTADSDDAAYSHIDAIHLAIAPVTVQVQDALVLRLQEWLTPLFEMVPVALLAPPSPLDVEIALATRPRRYIGRIVLFPVSLTITARFLYGLDRTPLSLSGVDVDHVSAFDDQLAKDLAANYVADALVRSPMVIMSLNVLGNPAGFVRDVSAGVQDLVRLPLLAIAEQGYSPVSITKGVVQGAVSFATHTSVAALSSVSGVAHAISRSMDHISAPTGDKSSAPPPNFTAGLASGFQSLGQSVVGAATGVVTTPLGVLRDNQEQGKRTGLAAGVVGVGRGLVGIVAQPMSGVASLVSMTTDGLLVDMGVGGCNDAAIPTRLPLTRNEPLFVRWKLVGVAGPGPIAFASALYVVDEHLEPLERPPAETLAWLLPEDSGRVAVAVQFVVSTTHVYIIDAARETRLETLALSGVAAVEQSLTMPTKLDVGVGVSAMQLAWFRFRLAMSDRRTLATAIARFKKW